MTIKVGDPAPDFELYNTEGSKTKLSDFQGNKNVLLAFFPFAFTRVCSTEFCELRDDNSDLVSDENVEIIGISVDGVPALRAWKKAENYPNSFVADFWPHGAVSQAYGVLNEHGVSHRAAFLIDKQGIVRYVDMNPTGAARDQGVWRKEIAAL
jgi:peroxiredoxin (alkyl hydroperoxide reductase subunit C)